MTSIGLVDAHQVVLAMARLSGAPVDIGSVRVGLLDNCKSAKTKRGSLKARARNSYAHCHVSHGDNRGLICFRNDYTNRSHADFIRTCAHEVAHLFVARHGASHTRKTETIRQMYLKSIGVPADSFYDRRLPNHKHIELVEDSLYVSSPSPAGAAQARIATLSANLPTSVPFVSYQTCVDCGMFVRLFRSETPVAPIAPPPPCRHAARMSSPISYFTGGMVMRDDCESCGKFVGTRRVLESN